MTSSSQTAILSLTKYTADAAYEESPMSYHDFKMMLLALTLSGIGLGFLIGLMVATLFFS